MTGTPAHITSSPSCSHSSPCFGPQPLPGACLSLTLLGACLGRGGEAPRVLTKITFFPFLIKRQKYHNPPKIDASPPPTQAGTHAASQALPTALPLVPAADAPHRPPSAPASPGSALHTPGWPLEEAAAAAWGTGQERGGGRWGRGCRTRASISAGLDPLSPLPVPVPILEA